MVKQQIDSLFSLWQEGLCPGGQVLVRRKGELIYDRCFGYADAEKRVPMTHDHVFHVASISKQFTAMTILLLWEEGKLSLEADIREYIPDLVAFAEPMPLWTLLHQVSGLRDMLELLDDSGVRNVDTITQQDIRTILAHQKGLNFPPESRHAYCNSNYMLLAEIVERVSGEGFHAFLKSRIFDPLGMDSTVVREHYWQFIPMRGVSYWDNGTEYCHCVLNYGNYGTTSLHTNARDLMKWMDNYRSPTICKPETLERMLWVPTLESGAPTNYACGLRVDTWEGHRYLKHAGRTPASGPLCCGCWTRTWTSSLWATPPIFLTKPPPSTSPVSFWACRWSARPLPPQRWPILMKKPPRASIFHHCPTDTP